MSGEKHELTEHRIEGTRPEVEIFKEAVMKADGTLIPLQKTTKDGKRLYIAARQISNPFDEDGNVVSESAYVNKEFYLWREERPIKPTGVLLIDVYADERGEVVPFGHEDWWLSSDYANGGGNMHDAAIPKNEYEQLAGQRWHRNDATAFKVDYDYHQQGLGSLMVATSAVVLPTIGIRSFYTGVMLNPAKKTFERFGIREKDFPEGTLGNPYARKLPIERLSKSPQIDKTISEFV